MVTFWVDEELEGGIKVAVGFADGADIVGGGGAKGGVCFRGALHVSG